MNKQRIIRRPMIEDREKMSAFFRLVLEDTFRKEGIIHEVYDLAEEIETKKKYLEMDFQSDGINRFFLIAEEEKEIIGTMEFGSTSSLILQLTKGELQHLPELGTAFVHPALQNQRVASMLLLKIEEEMRKRKIREYCLDSGYQRAQNVWCHKFGTPAYIFENHWGENAPHMIWRVSLPEKERSSLMSDWFFK